MSNAAIRVSELGKMYRIGAARGGMEGALGLRHVLERSLWQTVARIKGVATTRAVTEEFWALKDVSFEVKHGECMGVIGRNGAGKSTLLKVLSRITEPTKGEVALKGRVGSLLEVGTGFHAELSGRENIFLNGAILGMARKEIARKFDQIVAFSEVEKFLDTPVKYYSSGMYVRLAFAVAAHLEPEILIVDEVLAVGDANFQKKCLGRMSEVAGEGRTVLFVSHNMAAVQALCSSAVVMSRGALEFAGNVDDAVDRYMASGISNESAWKTEPNEYGAQLQAIEFIDAATSRSTGMPVFGRDYQLVLRFSFHRPTASAAIVVRIYDEIGTFISALSSAEEGIEPTRLEGELTCTFFLPGMPLIPRGYLLEVSVEELHGAARFLIVEALRFHVEAAIVRGGSWPYSARHGFVRLADGATLASHSANVRDSAELCDKTMTVGSKNA